MDAIGIIPFFSYIILIIVLLLILGTMVFYGIKLLSKCFKTCYHNEEYEILYVDGWKHKIFVYCRLKNV